MNSGIKYFKCIEEFKIAKYDHNSLETRKIVDHEIKFLSKIKILKNNALKSKTLKTLIIVSEDITKIRILLQKIEKHLTIYIICSKFFLLNPPLILISPPRAGSHYLMKIVESFGYKHGGILREDPINGHWYSLDYDSIHTSAKNFFNKKNIRGNLFGGKLNMFDHCITFVLFRHPVKILESRLNYFFNRKNSVMGSFLNGYSKQKKLQSLVDNQSIFQNINTELEEYLNWLYFPNVFPLSYEELNDPQLKKYFFWKIQCILCSDGNTDEVLKKTHKKSATYFIGKNICNDPLINDFAAKNINFGCQYFKTLGYSKDNYYAQNLKNFQNKSLTVLSELPFQNINIKVKETKNFFILFYNNQYTFAHKTKVIPDNLLKKFDTFDETELFVNDIENKLSDNEDSKVAIYNFIKNSSFNNIHVPYSVIFQNENYCILNFNKKFFLVNTFNLEDIKNKQIFNNKNIMCFNSLDEAFDKLNRTIKIGKNTKIIYKDIFLYCYQKKIYLFSKKYKYKPLNHLILKKKFLKVFNCNSELLGFLIKEGQIKNYKIVIRSKNYKILLMNDKKFLLLKTKKNLVTFVNNNIKIFLALLFAGDKKIKTFKKFSDAYNYLFNIDDREINFIF